MDGEDENWNPYTPPKWEWAAKHSTGIIVTTVVIVMAVALWFMP